MGRKAHRRVKTRDGGLLLGIEAPSLVFQHDGRVGVVKTPHRRVETRQGGVVSSGEAERCVGERRFREALMVGRGHAGG